MTEYLRQLKSGHIYKKTDALAKRNDMVPYDPDEAEVRIKAISEKIKKKKIKDFSKKETEEIKAQMERLRGNALVLNDMEILLEKIEAAEKRKTEADAAKDAGEEPAPAVKTEEEVQQEKEQEILEKDPQINSIAGMRTKAQIEEYMLTEYGIEVDTAKTVRELKDEAVAARKKRLFEGDG